MINQLPLCLDITDEHEAYCFTIPVNLVFVYQASTVQLIVISALRALLVVTVAC
jgi:hypothetical protein